MAAVTSAADVKAVLDSHHQAPTDPPSFLKHKVAGMGLDTLDKFDRVVLG